MKHKIFMLYLASFIFLISSKAQILEDKSVIVGQSTMSYRPFRLADRKENDPIIIFESGLGGSTFLPVIELLPDSLSGLEYDRAGLGGSTIDLNITNDRQVVERLHGLLDTLGLQPPYLLVGHSLGGPLIRLFADSYPNQVSGMVFSDPTDFMLTAQEDLDAQKASGSSSGYQEVVRHIMNTIIQDVNAPKGDKMEARRVLDGSDPNYFQLYRDLAPIPNIPVSVIISYNKPSNPQEIAMNQEWGLAIDVLPWWKEFDRLRIDHYADLIRNNSQSKLVLLPGYSHGIPHQDPKLIADTIIEVYARYFNKDN